MGDPKYKVTVYPELIGEYFAEFYAGLYELRDAGLVEFRFGHRSSHRARAVNHFPPLRLDIEQPGNHEKLKICFDPSDWPEIASMDDLREVDVYFKRSYDERCIGRLSEGLPEKILPMGLHYGCRSRNETVLGRLKQLLAHHMIGHNGIRSWPGTFLRLVGQSAKMVLTKHGLAKSGLGWPPFIEDFEVSPDTAAEPLIFFRARVYSPEEAKDTFRSRRLEAINEMRANIVRALRQHFGDRFVGGLRRTSFVEATYPDCVCPKELGLRGHLKLSKKCLVNVTTDGLHYSLSWKFPEYMAASRCIVSEAVKYEIPVDLEEGKHYLPFRTPQECVRACQELLDNAELANMMRQENHLYYRNHIRPDRLILRSLEMAFAHTRRAPSEQPYPVSVRSFFPGSETVEMRCSGPKEIA